MKTLLAPLALAAALLPAAARAHDMSPDEARAFVVGRTFAFACFEGTTGEGRVADDGSVAGVIQIQGREPSRFVRLPPNTLRERDGRICASISGVPFEPCFALQRRDGKSFTGAVLGFDFAACRFTRVAGERHRPRRAGMPLPIHPVAVR